MPDTAGSVPPVLQAASLKRARGVDQPDVRPGRVPPVLQAASLKQMNGDSQTGGTVSRSACIAGGLIEAQMALRNQLKRRKKRSACIAGGLIEALAGPLVQRPRAGGVPPVLQAASLKPLPAARGGGGGQAFRLYCRRPH